jgi:hypothetical protein
MITRKQLYEFLENPQLNVMVATIWELLGTGFRHAQALLPPEQAMDRKDLSFHDQIRLLACLCTLIGDLPGDIVEIGVWKGKSMSLMNEVCNHERRIVGIDPFALPKQYEEFSHSWICSGRVGYFNGFDVLGSVRGFENSYLIQKI